MGPSRRPDRASEQKVHVFTTGSLLDVAAAYNREPELSRDKVAAIHVNAGTGPDGYQEEWNVRLDPAAYRRVLLSDLPIRWIAFLSGDHPSPEGPRNMWCTAAFLELEDTELVVSFSHWAHGAHRLQLTFDDGTTETVEFHVPFPGSPRFSSTFDVGTANVHVLQQRPRYSEVMTSCLKNLLEARRFE